MRIIRTYKISQNEVMYHNTAPTNVESILNNGLKINSPYYNSKSSQLFIPQIYKLNPIFLSLNPNLFKNSGDVTLAINVAGLKLVTDIPSLAQDYGAYYGDLGEGIWFEEEMVPKMLEGLDDDGEIPYDDLLDPYSEVTQICIKLTKTAACMENINKERINKI